MTADGHLQTEAFLDRFDCIYEHDAKLDLDDIDLSASITNQARFDAIHPATVDRYTEAVADGAVFPPVIVRRVVRPNGDRKHVVLSGNHRVRAHIDARCGTIDAYLVDCDDLTALEISYADNATHGLPTTDAERVAHALVLVERGRSIEQAARVVGISRYKIDARLKSTAQERRAARCRIPAEFARLPTSTQATLSSVKEDKVFVALVRAIDKHKIASGPGGAQRLIGDANSQPDIQSALAIINLNASSYAEERTGARPIGRPSENPYIKLRMALGTIRGLNAADVVERCSDIAETRQLLRDCVRHVMAIDKLLELEQAGARLEVVR